MTATITTAASKFPTGATLRAVGLQGYFQQDLDLPLNATAEASLHAIAAVAPVTGDAKRREVVDSAKCGQCHEWFEGHGGNRVYNINICTMCHVPNLSSSGRELTAYFTAPEDSQNLKDMIHGIHSSAFRTRDYEHVRNRSGGIYYNWSEVTFPAETNNCTLCHKDGTYDLPLADGVLPTTVRTTGVANGLDANPAAVTAARAGTALPNATDWVNTPTASSCFYCHTSDSAYAHMVLSGAQLSHPLTSANAYTNRSVLGSVEACVTCHGAGKSVDVTVVHGR
jgi:OmcA/MtrC family decaheme c-type cytochrome